jgi:hypothetical protein
MWPYAAGKNHLGISHQETVLINEAAAQRLRAPMDTQRPQDGFMRPQEGRLDIQWHHADEPQGILCVTRHMIWEDMREINELLHALFPERAADANNNQQETGL